MRTTTMNDAYFYAIFTIISITLYTPSLLIKLRFSGENFSNTAFTIAIIYSVIITTLHWNSLETGTVAFLVSYDTSGSEWLSLTFIFIQALTLPSKFQRKYGYSHGVLSAATPNKKIITPYPERFRDKAVYLSRLYVSAASSAFILTLFLNTATVHFYPAFNAFWEISNSVLFFTLLAFNIYAIHAYHKKYGMPWLS